MNVNSFFGRVGETVLVHLTAKVAGDGVTRVLEPATDKAKQLWRKFRAPSAVEQREAEEAAAEAATLRGKNM